MKKPLLVLLLGIASLFTTTPASAQTQCTTSQDAAVQCFVKNAVSARLASLPSGMSMTQYEAYGVAVSKTLQSPTVLMFLAGMTSAVSDALPSKDANGSANEAAQITAINAIVAAGLKDALFTLPAEVSLTQLQQVAQNMTAMAGENTGLLISPGALLRTLDSYLVSATNSASGAAATVNWLQVTNGLSTLVDNLVSTGLMKLPNGVASSEVKQFALDVCTAIEQYKLATQKAHL